MKRYNIEGDGLPEAYHVEEARDGDWVRYEDAAAALERRREYTAEKLAELATAQAAARAYHAELEELRARVTALCDEWEGNGEVQTKLVREVLRG